MGARAISDDEDDYEEDGEARDVEAGVDDDEDEEEEDEEEGQDEYEKDGFIVDEDEEEDEEEEEAEEDERARESSDEEAKARKRKRKKRAEENDQLDEDDYELLREANITGFHRPPPKSGNKTKFKRLKKAGKTGGDDGGSRRGLSDDEEEEEEGSKRGRTAEEELKRTLFGDDEGVPPDDVAEEEEPEEEEEIGEEDDEMADFIVDEEEGEDDGQPFRRKKTKKKKAPRQAPGISSFALQEAQDIFGDVSALLDERRQREMEAQKAEMDVEEEDDGFGRRRPSKMLEKQFEPSLLEEKYMTERDDVIRDTDVAERLQLLEEVAGPFPKSEPTAREAHWIYERTFGSQAILKHPEFERIAKMEKEDIVRQIDNVLHLIHEEKLELPFIAMYRKEKCLGLLQDPDEGNRDSDSDRGSKLKLYEALWAVHHWDKKWLLLKRRKSGLQAAYEKRNLVDSRKGMAREELFQKLLQSLSEAQSEQAVDDVDAKFNLHFPPDEVDVEPGQFKRPKRRSFYSVCRKAGLAVVANFFGLTPEKFGENISAMYKRHEVEDEASTPEEVANNHLGGEFRDPVSVLKGARHMAAVEISTEPAVREYVRHVYMERAVISTRPTIDGNTAIDSFHQYAGVKWLQQKPVHKFEDAQWLLIQKAEEEKLLEVSIGLPKNAINDPLILEFESYYLSEGVSRTAQLWNEQRKEILKDALLTMLLPAMEKEVRMTLTARGKQWVAAQCGKELWNKVSVAPYSDPKNDENQMDYDGLPPRVMACCWGPGKPATTFVMLDAAGEIVNILHTGYLTIRAGSPEQQQRKKQDQAKLLEFMMENQPHVVVLGVANLSCRHLLEDIHEVTFKIVEEHPRELAEGLDTINVVFGDETIPQLYENSRISEEQLVGHPGIVRRAVALGRYLQNPLAMVATLCGPGKEVLSLKLSSLQHFLSPDEVYEAVERTMVTVANQVGVDVNMAASHDWLFAPLQFLSGLGPRKASYIQRSIQGAGRVGTRKELLLTLRLMGRKVFINAAGFIRVRGTGQASTGNQIMDPLDDTRIHPESYEVAKRMAEDAYCEEEGTKADDMDDDALELAIEHVKRHPRYLANMDMEAYATHLQEKGPIRNLQTLQLIQMELQHGYQEWRVRYREPNEDEAFFMLSGETEDTLTEGCIVHVTVRKVQQNRVMCVLESGLMGIISQKDLSDENNTEPADKVSEGEIVTCRVKEVNKATFLVILTSKGSDLRGERWTSQRPRDKYYSQDTSFLQGEQEKAKKKIDEEKRKAFKPRMIVHPQFQNVSLAEATEALEAKDVGEVIIRPSSKGPSHLSMTLKFYDGVYVNIDIVEGGKDSRDMTSFLRLGKTLTIGDETFEDLDEVIARYVDPLVGYLKDVLRYRKFRRGSKAEVDEALRIEKKDSPMRIPYFFSICHEHPGAFRLSYIKSVSTVSHEYISVSPKGLKFRKRVFDGPDKLVFYFQNHFKDPLPEVAPRRAVAAMVPARSPAPSGAGSHRGGQWGPGRSGEGTTSSGWDSTNGWDWGGGRGRNGGAWGRGLAASGSGSDWDRQAGGGSSSGWDRAGPPSQGQGTGWNSWDGSIAAGYSGGRGSIVPPSGQAGWDRSQQGPRDGFKSGANGWGGDTGFSEGASLTPLSETGWGSRKTTAAGGTAWDSAGSTWEQSSVRTPTRSGWDSEQESLGTGRSSWGTVPASKPSWDKPGQVRTGPSVWEQSRGDPRRGGAIREGNKQIGSAWDNSGAKQASESGWESTEPTVQSGGSSAWDASGNSTLRKVGGNSWEKSAEQRNQSESGWTSMEPESATDEWASGPSNKGKDGSSWTQPSLTSPADSAWVVSQSDNWDSEGGTKEKPTTGDSIDQAQESSKWDHTTEVGSKDPGSRWETPKEKSFVPIGLETIQTEPVNVGQHGWDPSTVEKGGSSNWDQLGARQQGQRGGERQRADPRRGKSGWDQSAREDAPQGGWEGAAAKGGRNSRDQSGYSPAPSSWSSDWERIPNSRGGDSISEHPPSKPTPESSWNTDPEAHNKISGGWVSSEPGVPGVPESSSEPAAPGTSRPTDKKAERNTLGWEKNLVVGGVSSTVAMEKVQDQKEGAPSVWESVPEAPSGGTWTAENEAVSAVWRATSDAPSTSGWTTGNDHDAGPNWEDPEPTTPITGSWSHEQDTQQVLPLPPPPPSQRGGHWPHRAPQGPWNGRGQTNWQQQGGGMGGGYRGGRNDGGRGGGGRFGGGRQGGWDKPPPPPQPMAPGTGFAS